MALQNATEDAIHTAQTITWTRGDGTAQNLTGATITGTIRNARTGATQTIAGSLSLVTPASGIFTWTYAAADVANAGEYQVQFAASYGGQSDVSLWYDWLVLPIASSSTPRSTMLHLIARLRKLCGGDTAFDDFDYLELLDDHAVAIDCVLEPRAPFYTEHVAPFGSIEIGARVFYGYNTLLTESTDYTADYQRGIITTPAANYQGLRLQGKAYDINAAAADGWERIAQRTADAFDWSDVEGSYKPSQARDFALGMAAKFRRKAWAISRTVERGDTPALIDAGSYNADVIRRAKAGY